MENDQVKFPVLVTAPNGKATAIDHIVRLDISALESHKTVLVQTTVDAFMIHDDAAVQIARMYGLVPPAPGADAVAPKKETPALKRVKG